MSNTKTKTKKWHSISKEEFEKSGVLTPEKCEIMFHRAGTKTLIGGKGAGKSNVATSDGLYQFENKPFFSAVGIRLEKGQASDKLSSLFTSSVDTFNIKGFKTYNYTRVYNQIYQKIIKSSNDKNNRFIWGSLDASGATDGMQGVQGGTIGLLLLDEPLVKGSKPPTKEEWVEDCHIRTDNLERTVNRYNELHGTNEKFTTYYCLNPWGDHPVLDRAEEIFPEINFEKFIFSGFTLNELLKDPDLVEKNWKRIQTSLLTNHTMTIYDKKSDELVARMTKFANPLNCTPKKIEEIMYQVKWNLRKGKRNAFCILLGLKNEQVNDPSMLVYDIKDYRLTTLDRLVEHKWEPIAYEYSLDIDTAREFNIIGAIFLRKKVKNHNATIMDEPWKYIYHLHLLPQMVINAYGTGDYGELNDVYVKDIINKIDNHYNKYIVKYNLFNGVLWVDDNRMSYANEIKKAGSIAVNRFRMFRKNGRFDIITRQDITQSLFKTGKVSVDPSNKELVRDMRHCVKDDINSPKRKTTSTTNHLDGIDTMEQLFWSFVGRLSRQSNSYTLKDQIGGSYE